jgi:hypothetical protein
MPSPNHLECEARFNDVMAQLATAGAPRDSWCDCGLSDMVNHLLFGARNLAQWVRKDAV